MREQEPCRLRWGAEFDNAKRHASNQITHLRLAPEAEAAHRPETWPPAVNPGDTVTVRGTANSRLRRMIERGAVELLSHEPKPVPEPLKVGDSVRWREGVTLPSPIIEAVEDGHAVVRLPLSIFDRL